MKRGHGRWKVVADKAETAAQALSREPRPGIRVAHPGGGLDGAVVGGRNNTTKQALPSRRDIGQAGKAGRVGASEADAGSRAAQGQLLSDQGADRLAIVAQGAVDLEARRVVQADLGAREQAERGAASDGDPHVLPRGGIGQRPE